MDIDQPSLSGFPNEQQPILSVNKPFYTSRIIIISGILLLLGIGIASGFMLLGKKTETKKQMPTMTKVTNIMPSPQIATSNMET